MPVVRPRPPLSLMASLMALLMAAAMAALLAGCVASLDTTAPRGFDLTGEWLLDERQSDAPPDLNAIRRREDRDVVRNRQSNPSASAAFVVQDYPVLNAVRLHIEQDAQSMGIRYGENAALEQPQQRSAADQHWRAYRDISWGVRKRDFWTVNAGWADGALVIRTARGDVRGEEVMALEDGGRRLRIAVRVTTEGEDVHAERVYRRQR